MDWEYWILWTIPILIGTGIAWFFYNKSASKKDVKDLKEITKKSNESTNILVQKGVEEIKKENILIATVKLENLINSQFNRYLEQNKMDRKLLIKELEGNKIRTLYVIKQQEEAIEDKRLLTERIKILGFKRVAYGDWILPPKKIKDTAFFREKEGVKKWVEKNLLHGIKEHNFVNSVVIVDLSNLYDEQKGQQKKAKKIIGGVLKPADLISKDKLLCDIHRRDKISLKELIQIPFLDVLINQEHPDISEKIKRVNAEIVNEISQKLGVKRLTMNDLMNVTEQDLGQVLSKHDIKNEKNISKQILNNVRILYNYFNKDSELSKNLQIKLEKKV